ncbi:MAG: glycosyltransferase family 39 protein, partial [Dehalococcoidia bacterium]|nr:glycosyltransferase family 39 protein [Dehalococcoidia bacterium]
MTIRALAPDQSRTAVRAFVALVGLFVVFRLGALLSWRPGGYVVDWTERYFFQGWLRYVDAGYLPYLDFWMEYPPLLPWFGVAAYWLAQGLPPWQDATLWFSLTTGLPLLIADVVSLTLIWAIARRLHGETAALLAAAIFSALLIPLYFWLSGFDGPALTSVLAAVWLALPRADSPRMGMVRAVAAGVAIGLGMQYKLMPVAVAPVVALALWFSARRWSAAAFVGTAVAVNVAVTLP